MNPGQNSKGPPQRAGSLLAQQQLESSHRALCCEFQGMPLWIEVPVALNPVLNLGGTFASLEALGRLVGTK